MKQAPRDIRSYVIGDGQENHEVIHANNRFHIEKGAGGGTAAISAVGVEFSSRRRMSKLGSPTSLSGR